MAQQTQINGNRFSFTSISVTIGGIDQPKGVFKSINYSAKQEPGKVEGNQITPIGYTSGYGEGSGDFEMLASEFDDLAKTLSQNNSNAPLMSCDFDISVSYSVNGTDTRTDKLRGCRITAVESSNSAGSDATMKKASLLIRRVTMNGIDMFADPST